MSDGTEQSAQGQVTPSAQDVSVTSQSATVIPPVAQSTQSTGEEVRLTSAQLKARLAEERETARKNLLKEYGYEKREDLAAVLKAAKDAEDAKLSEIDRLRKQVEEAKPQLARVSVLEQRVAAMVEAQFSELPENVRSAIDGVANGDPEERLRMIEVFRKSGLLTQKQAAQAVATQAAVAAVQQQAAQPTTTQGAAPLANTGGAPPPKPTATKTAFEQWQDLERTNRYAASFFLQTNKAAIDATRPARS
jgi:hypothetical protein